MKFEDEQTKCTTSYNWIWVDIYVNNIISSGNVIRYKRVSEIGQYQKTYRLAHDPQLQQRDMKIPKETNNRVVSRNPTVVDPSSI